MLMLIMMVSNLQTLPTTVKDVAERRERALHAKYDMEAPRTTLSRRAARPLGDISRTASSSVRSPAKVKTRGTAASRLE